MIKPGQLIKIISNFEDVSVPISVRVPKEELEKLQTDNIFLFSFHYFVPNETIGTCLEFDKLTNEAKILYCHVNGSLQKVWVALNNIQLL